MKIGEVARRVGVAASAMRFYEGAGPLPEAERTPSGYREYGPSVIDRLVFIRAGQAVGLTLAHLKAVLRPCPLWRAAPGVISRRRSCVRDSATSRVDRPG